MKNYTFGLFFLCLMFSASFTHAQGFEVPQDYAFSVKEDYAKFNHQIIAAAEWLENTPLDKEAEKRQQVNAFLFKWVSGSPEVSVELHQYVSTFSEKNPQLLIVFLGGWARHQLQHPAEKDKIKLHSAGLESVLNAYEQGGVRKDKGVEKLLKVRNKEKLDAWLKKKLG